MNNYLLKSTAVCFLLLLNGALASTYNGPKLGKPEYTATDRKHVRVRAYFVNKY